MRKDAVSDKECEHREEPGLHFATLHSTKERIIWAVPVREESESEKEHDSASEVSTTPSSPKGKKPAEVQSP